MRMDSTLQKTLHENKAINLKQAEQLGISKMTLSNYHRAGLLDKFSHGIYYLADDVVDDCYALTLVSSKFVFSHETALFLNGLSERTPFAHTVTFASNSSIPKTIKEQCQNFYVKPELFALGICERQTTFGNTVRCYDVERTICDLLRSRNKLDEETVISGVKNCLLRYKVDYNKLAHFAEAFRVLPILKNYTEVLL